MSDLTALAVGDPIVVSDSQGRYRHAKVTKVGRVWLTDEHNWKYRRDDGEAEERLQFGRGTQAMTVAEWEAKVETEQLKDRLRSWGWVVPQYGKVLTLAQLRRAAALLSEFEAEGTGGAP